MKGLTGLLGLAKGAGRERRTRLRLTMEQTAVYAVGDVHGCLDLLLDLERAIAADAAELPGGKVIVMLGDYVDRGPASAQVIDHLLATPDVPAPVALAQPKVLYEFADPALEQLSAGQKIMIRMGPVDESRAKAKLRQIRRALTGQKLPR